jgi:hypothetical protein
MKRTARNTFAACALPLLLLLLTQGGSCGGGRAGNDAQANATLTAAPSPVPKSGTAATPTPAANTAGANTERGGSGATANTNSNTRGEAGMSDGQKKRLSDGVWGGTGVNLQVKDGRATVEFDCAHGQLEEFSLEADGRFSARGTFTRERGGPDRVGEERPVVRATYSGEMSGETMTLRVSLEGDTEFDFTLRRGSHGRLRKCL